METSTFQSPSDPAAVSVSAAAAPPLPPLPPSLRNDSRSASYGWHAPGVSPSASWEAFTVEKLRFVWRKSDRSVVENKGI